MAGEEFQALASDLAKNMRDVMVTGVGGSARHLYYAGLYLWMQEHKRIGPAILLVVTHSSSQAATVYEDLQEFLPEERVLLYPERELSVVDMMAYSPEVLTNRLQVLEALTNRGSCVVVATVASVVQPVMNRNYFRESTIEYVVGDRIELNQHVAHLIQMGYERVQIVESKAQFSLRGGILDVFPVTADAPLRIELFDDEVDSIRSFDVESQRSLDKRKTAQVGPALDFLVPERKMFEAAEALEERLTQRIVTTTNLEVRDRLQAVIGEDIRTLKEGTPFYGELRYEQLMGKDSVQTLLDYLTKDSLVSLDEPTRLQERQKGLERDYSEWVSAALMRGELVSGTIGEPRYDELWQHPALNSIHFSTFYRPTKNQRYQSTHTVTAKTMQNFHGQMHLLKAEVERWVRNGIQVLLFASSPERAERLDRVLSDYRIDAVKKPRLGPSKQPQILVASLSSGFELPLSHVAAVVETEVFSAKQKTRRHRKEMSDAERIKSYQELHEGDYVVHINHGIGKYLGIKTLEIEGKHRDYLYLQYAGNDSLYVPVEQIDQVQRYVGSEDKTPKMYSLGGGEWNRVKQRVSKSVRDIAEDLVKLYASRQAAPGHGFGKDTGWQSDFEAMFPYEETPDQLTAIEDIKKDMEKGRPMDRLLCGDVGYGKTEVAIRAAFKAVMDGKQVAVLVPTTVLAHQHFETFKERFAGFPISVDVLSRFRTRTEAKRVVEGVKEGSIDIVIGTHRLLNKSIKFHDLGLLIVDEEQRFGVTHKERLKQLRTNVDCLTLTATPIPRTLHMSLLGVRDLSVIETPPENRFPVQTYVVEFNESLIRESIERELGRGGQVYFLFNNVKSIQSMADRVMRLVPDARVATAHGQMAENELEQIMLDFLEGDIDVLVTTTIIETGLDIPNVNTLIVSDADRLGLSQLYQLRGRVGRSNRIAYAYFTYQKDKVLTEVAEKRLQAIKEFTELGSGFKIAMRDLAIRGAGNLLGAEQHGFINSVGFDMYNDMLSKAVKEVRGDNEKEVPEPTIELPIEAYLSDEFIPDAAQKIEMYKKFKFIRSLESADDLEEELEDRYGDLPDASRNLLDITRLKSYAVQCDLDAITTEGSEVVLRVRPDASSTINHSRWFQLSKQHAGQYSKRSNGTLQISFRIKGMGDREICQRLLRFMSELTEVSQENEEVEEFAK
ncbi:transcription-repair coupling factor [Alicyclobacillus sp. SO9]|nr:transcription-repair coupling factor [Alicyclobacillus sp. SO9]